MTRYFIIEDEPLAYKELRRMIESLRPDYALVGWAASVEQAVVALGQVSADLVFADIKLQDGDSFEIFDHAAANVPLIFTTAYDDYALRAFRLNSVDYLLKPIEPEHLERALDKYERRLCLTPASDTYAALRREMAGAWHKTRLMVQHGDAYEFVPTREAACFYSEDKCTLVHTFAGRRHILSYSLDDVERMLDAAQFFRVSRSLIINIDSVKRITKYFSGRLQLHLVPALDKCPLEPYVSRSRATAFLKWIDGEGAAR